LIMLSWLSPKKPVMYNDLELFRGAFGSPNSMGQIAAVGALLFFHGFLTGKSKWLRWPNIVMAYLAAWLVWSSGARSAMAACIAGTILINYFYRDRLRGIAFWVIILASGLALAFPTLPKALTTFALRSNANVTTFSEQIFVTRIPVWSAAWEGFKKRPLLGWGFGADDRVSKHWEPKLTSIGTTSRDSVNDTLITLESTGIVGLIAYVLLITLAVRQIPTRQQRMLISRMHGPPFSQRRGDFSAYHVHSVAFIISIALIITVQFDNTALSAGNFVSVTLWLCVALAGAIKSKAVLFESAVGRYQHLSSRSDSHSLTNTSVTPQHVADAVPT